MPVKPPAKFKLTDTELIKDDAPKKFDIKETTPLSEDQHFASAQPSSKHPTQQYLDDMERDLREGGNRTFLGRALGHAQGRGDEGYAGLNQGGNPKGVVDFMGSVPLGSVKMAQGIAEMHNHPVKGTLKTLSGALQVGAIPSAVVGGPAAETAIEAIPSRKVAAELFKDVSEHAGNVPVELTRSGDELLKMKEMADAGGKLPPAIRKLLERYTAPIKGAIKGTREGARPLTYNEARKFYENITDLSASDKMGLNKNGARQLNIVREALKHDIGEAANQVGQSAKYYAAMKNYAQASKLLRAAHTMGKWAIGAAGAGSAIEVYQAAKNLGSGK